MSYIKKFLNRIFIDGLSGMATGLFSTLIIGTIISQTGTLIGGEIGKYVVLQDTAVTRISSPRCNLHEYSRAAIVRRFADEPEFDITAYFAPNFSAKARS